MSLYRTYIQQLSFNGIEYTKGDVIDILNKYNIVCQEFPFVFSPKVKPLDTLDWAGEDGVEVYTPKHLPLEDYDLDAEFICTGSKDDIRQNIVNFINFLHGRDKNAVGCRLAVYNEYTGIGRKDVIVSEVKNELFFVSDNDPDSVARFSIKFHVYDPVTEVTPTYIDADGDKKVSQLNFE